MPEVPVKKHWIVAAFEPSEEDDEIGTVGTIDSQIHSTYTAALERSRTLAAENAGQHYVIYEADSWSHTDTTPVHTKKVVTSVVA
jgi:hypothetical protein